MSSRDKPIPEPGDSRDDSGPSNRADRPMLHSSIGSGLIAQQPTPEAEEQITVTKICLQCGAEYETADRFCPRDGSALRPKGGDDPLIGRVIADRYLILAKLGQGGMGRVYVAEHVKMNRQCAIKVMNPTLINDSESTTRFAREASNAARVLHPNVAAVFDYGESDRVVYLVMEYVDGESLSTILEREGALDPRRAIDIARQIADGLFAAHELGLIHRDLKPDNVIVAARRDGRETAKVVDFGIAKAVSDAPQDSLTRSGLVIGTPEYMSPEQLLGDPVDARSDIYSLGCMLYQMLTGVRPFQAESREQTLRRRLHEPPPHVRDIRPELPRRLDTLIAHMLARAPGERVSSAAEVSAQLDPALVLSGWDMSTFRASIKTARVTPVVTPLSTDPAMQPTVRLARHRESITRLVVGFVVGGGMVSAVVLLWSLWTRNGLNIARLEDTPTPGVNAVSSPPSIPAIVVPQIAPAPLPTASHDSAAPAPKTTPPRRQSTATPKPAATHDSTSSTTAPTTPAEATEDDAILNPLKSLATAMGNGETAIRGVFPGMPQPLLESLKSQFYSKVVEISPAPTFGPPNINGDTAEVDFTLRLSYTLKDSGSKGAATLRYRATLLRHGDVWEITNLVVAP